MLDSNIIPPALGGLLFLFVGIALGALWHRARVFPFDARSQRKSESSTVPPIRTEQQFAHKPSEWLAEIQVEYTPKFNLERDDRGNEYLVNENGKASLQVPANQVALVLMDTWGEPNEIAAPTLLVQNQKRLLEQCRRYGVTIIHSPNHPVVDKYPQYQRLRTEVAEFSKAFEVRGKNPPPFMRWPSRDNATFQRAREIREAGRAPGHKVRPIAGMEISHYLTPLSDEYVLASAMEFRYVLWREGINLLLYIGKSLNECILHRETGINLLVGTDNTRVPITIVVFKDCSVAGSTPEFNRETMTAAMLAYYKHKLAFVADSSELSFRSTSPEKDRNTVS